MNYIFSAIGGAGSKYLINTLKKRYKVGNKPDTIFHVTVGAQKVDQGTFEDRSGGFKLRQGESFESVFLRYVNYLSGDPNQTAVFNTAAENQLFSKYKIDNVIYLIRHPLHAYVSWCKNERHGNLVEPFGGVNSRIGVEHFAKRWISVVQDYLKWRELELNGGLIRFEYAKSDSSKFNDLIWIFNKWDCNLRNYGILNDDLKTLLHEIVFREYYLLYSSWDI